MNANNQLQLIAKREVTQLLDSYPEKPRERLYQLRQWVIEEAESLQQVTRLEESLKWNEPSYRSNVGSTLRMDWKPATPEQVMLYFSCSTSLVPTFKSVFREQLTYEGNRAIVSKLNQALPGEPIKTCIAAALRYHQIKALPLLGL
ncbi:DUF1801 domain-containing protein [Croceiramulus getboli]|nr:DUF1801 domain-containing protein [Flavobacteriaceae bacterium YJPT1-3]